MIGILLFAIIIFIIIFYIAKGTPGPGGIFEDPVKRAGRKGEQEAADIIRSVLREGDKLFTNVRITFDNKPAEMDDVVVNKYGVFIIEVKNYTGRLYGGEDDFKWSKYKTTDAGHTYEKTVKNPIKQVKRQTYILARYLEYYGCKVWVEGRAFLLQGNSPVVSSYIVDNIEEIDRLIHTSGRNRLNYRTVDMICNLLKEICL